MRIKKSIFLVLTSLLIISCVKESDMWESTYKIKNNSESEVILRVFKLFENGDFEDYNLLINESYIGVKTETSNFDFFNDSENTLPSLSYSSDSIYVVFNNERINKHINLGVNGNNQFSSPENRNLFRGGNYSNIGNDIFQFVLTQEDFNNAMPCDGGCLD